MLNRSPEGFNIEEALQVLIEKYGQAADESKEKSTKKKRKSNAAEDGEEGEGKEEVKKVRKTEQIANEDNRPLAEAIKEIADINFKQKEMRTGGIMPTCYLTTLFKTSMLDRCIGVFSKAAKAIRECETPITSGKEAMKLQGIGKGIAGYIDEFLTTGSINKLEELRASM